MDFVGEVLKKMQTKRSKYVEQFMKHKDEYQKALNAGGSARAIYQVAKANKMFTGGGTTFAKLLSEHCTIPQAQSGHVSDRPSVSKVSSS